MKIINLLNVDMFNTLRIVVTNDTASWSAYAPVTDFVYVKDTLITYWV